MTFSGFQKTDLINYPSNIAATVFVRGCNFRCPYCHNPSLVLPDEYSEEVHCEQEIFDYLEQRRSFIDGLVVTGGEPTLYPELPEFVLKVKGMGFSVKLDTNGTNPQMIDFLVKSSLVDYVAMDIKAPLEKYHLFSVAEADCAEKVVKTMEILRNSQVEYEFRTTCPEDILSKEDFTEIAKMLKKNEHWFLQVFNPRVTLDPSFAKVRSYTEEELKAIANNLKKYADVSLR
ncbi:MAG: anaerobic ribonucleoside-triphosphate reductase activating protein [Sphaerochaetaceae bacterium]|nr:anaerobic ribonucleoside-triphosphate reductase activating protein [Sphaerochaetaceae bacterium]